jgi:23S rRNA (guanosine2251-2'-O)-methyltransferase
MSAKKQQLEGVNSVTSAIKAGHKIEIIYVSESAKPGRMRDVFFAAEKRRIPIERVARQKLDAMSFTQHHQGIIAMMRGTEAKPFEDVVDEILEREQNPLFVMLDGVQDPHNLGAIIRTAECAGASCVVIPERRSAKVTAVAASASAGAINLIPIAEVNNMNRAIEYLQKLGVWVLGTAMGGKNYDEADYKGKTAIVMGSEGGGLHRLTAEKCDDIVGIRMYGDTSSLNVSVAAGIVLFEAAKQRFGGA